MTKRLQEVCHYRHRRCATALRFAEVVTTIEALGGKPTAIRLDTADLSSFEGFVETLCWMDAVCLRP